MDQIYVRSVTASHLALEDEWTWSNSKTWPRLEATLVGTGPQTVQDRWRLGCELLAFCPRAPSQAQGVECKQREDEGIKLRSGPIRQELWSMVLKKLHDKRAWEAWCRAPWAFSCALSKSYPRLSQNSSSGERISEGCRLPGGWFPTSQRKETFV